MQAAIKLSELFHDWACRNLINVSLSVTATSDREGIFIADGRNGWYRMENYNLYWGFEECDE